MASKLILSGIFSPFIEPIHIKILYGKHFSRESSEGLFKLVCNLFKNARVSQVDEDLLEIQLREQILEEKLKNMIIFPGATTTRDWALKKSLKERIISQNKTGEILLVGVCAGAFFLSQDSQFNKVNREHENYVPIFQGSCVGPVFGKPEDSSEIGYSINTTEINVFKHTTMKVAVSGAGYFDPRNIIEDKDYQVLARYESVEGQPIAALACTPLEGYFNTLLIGPHFEYEADDLKKN